MVKKCYYLRNRQNYVKSNQKNTDVLPIKTKENELDISESEKKFIEKTIEPNIFHIEDVLADNACFYRCISNFIHSKEKCISEINSKKKEKTSRRIQKIISKWLFDNRNEMIDELNISVKDFVIHTHNLLDDYDYGNYQGDNLYEEIMKEYLRRYSLFAGDLLLSEYDRWGGASEQYAISEILQVPIYIYVYKKYNKKNGNIENGKIRQNKPEKNVRFELYQVFGEKYLPNESIHLLYKNTKNCQGHYLCLYKK